MSKRSEHQQKEAVIYWIIIWVPVAWLFILETIQICVDFKGYITDKWNLM